LGCHLWHSRFCSIRLFTMIVSFIILAQFRENGKMNSVLRRKKKKVD
jgi:hypothetical protein